MAYIEQLLGVHGLLNGQSLDLHYATMPHNRADDGKNCARQDGFADPAHAGSAGDAGRRFRCGRFNCWSASLSTGASPIR